MMQKKWLVIGTIISLFIVFLVWLFVESSKPLPGTKIADLGRGHVPIAEQVDYNSNPPTSGKHYKDWIRSGVYAEPKDDRNLVHSLEHGYVIMHYKCSASESANLTIRNSEATPSQSPSEFSEICRTRRDELAKIYEKKGKTKLIVVPRPNLDARIALTAWTYLDKFDTIDRSRIEKFIDAHLNQGPEKTME